jgi:hypothetical protein
MTLIEILSILTIHWFADFVMQTDKQAKGKSKNWDDLLSHTISYSSIWLFISIFYGLVLSNHHYLIFFAPITFITHTITDYFTSRLNSRLWAKGDVHNFFVSVGFDQVLHYLQLFLTYKLLMQ